MLNKILVFGGLSVAAILVIENMVLPTTAYVLWFIADTWTLAISCVFIGVAIGYGLKAMGNNSSNEEYDNEDF